MPANYGRRPFQTTGYDVQVSADGHPEYKIGGITLDAGTLPVNNTGSALTLIDQTVVQPGEAYLLFGTTMCRITTGETDVVTINGTPTGGTFTVSTTGVGPTQAYTATITGVPTGGTFTLTTYVSGVGATTTPLAYNATASTVQTAVQALANIGSGNAVVSGSTGGPYTITFNPTLGNVALTAAGAALTGGTTPGVVIAGITAASSTQTTTGIAYNATAATVQTAINALSNVGFGLATVTGSTGGPYAVAYNSALGAVTTTASGASLTGGTAPTATVTSNLAGGSTGLFGPFNSAATDGRQNTNPGDTFVLNKTWLDTPVPAFPNQGTAHPAVIEGGRVDMPKLVLSTGQGTNALPSGYPAGPTFSALCAALPRLSFVKD